MQPFHYVLVFFSNHNYKYDSLNHFTITIYLTLKTEKIMRITKSLLMSAILSLFIGTAAMANGGPTEKSSRIEIKELIQKSDAFKEIKKDMTIHINFMVNDKNEIIILSTDDSNMDKLIKGILNYKKLKSSDIKINTKYTLPLVLKK